MASANCQSSRHIDTEPFKEELAEWMIEHNIGPEQLYNTDETGLYWKMMPSKTLASASENTAAGFKKVKDRVSILACTNAAGTHKLSLLLIGKSQKPRCFKHVNQDRFPVTYRAQNNTWMTATIFQEWFKNVFVPKVKTHLGSLRLPLRAMLLIDNCPAHPPDLSGYSRWSHRMPFFACRYHFPLSAPGSRTTRSHEETLQETPDPEFSE